MSVLLTGQNATLQSPRPIQENRKIDKEQSIFEHTKLIFLADKGFALDQTEIMRNNT